MSKAILVGTVLPKPYMTINPGSVNIDEEANEGK